MYPKFNAIWENIDGCAEHYRFATALYLISMLSQAFSVFIDHGISAQVHGREVVDGIKIIEKCFSYNKFILQNCRLKKGITHIW